MHLQRVHDRVHYNSSAIFRTPQFFRQHNNSPDVLCNWPEHLDAAVGPAVDDPPTFLFISWFHF